MANNFKNNRGIDENPKNNENVDPEVEAMVCNQNYLQQGPGPAYGCPDPRMAQSRMQRCPSTSYANYSISTTAVTNGTFLPLTLTSTGTTNYNLSSGITVTLPAGCVYLITYTVQAVLPDIGVFTVVPVINNTLNNNLSSTVNSYTGGTGTFSVSGSFLVTAEQATTLALQVVTDQTTTGAVTGNLSIVAVSSIYQPTCF
ncbi:MAG: hypothetical protein Q4F05_19830 [bacterium]|nr:hypothetical protein [bacterium]